MSNNKILFGPTRPPDNYKSIKISLNKLLCDNKNNKKDQISAIIFDAVERMNEITMHTYQLLRLYILKKYHANSDIPTITKKFIKTCFQVLLKSSPGPKNKHENFNELNLFFEEEYAPLIHKNNEKLESVKFNGINLSQIISYQTVDILTNITNNIQMHFTKYLKQFIVRSIMMDVYKFNDNNDMLTMYNDLLNDESISETNKKKYRVNLYTLKNINNNNYKCACKEAYSIMDTLLTNSNTVNPIFDKWIKKYSSKILPTFKHSFEDELKNNPQIFLKYMIFMNNELEKKGCKQYQFMPLRKSFIPKYITLDTKSLIELFVEKDKNKYLSDIEGCKEHVWSSIINMNHNIFKPNKEHHNYLFNYMIMTDGIAVSVIMVHEDQSHKDIMRKSNMKNGKLVIKNMTLEEKKEYKIEKDKKKMIELNLIRAEKAIIQQKRKQELAKFNESLNGLSSKEKKEKRDERRLLQLNERGSIKQSYIEFPYIDEKLSDEQIVYINSCKKVYIDPGMIRILMAMDDEKHYFCYSNKEHVYKTKRLKYQSELEKYKNNHGITKIENRLTKVNSKTCNYENFKQYITLKTQIYKLLYIKYADNKFRKYKWYGFINRKRTEDNLLNTLCKKYGNGKNAKKKTILIMGDWQKSDKLKWNISTPNIKLKRKLNEKYEIYNLDEYRTSCLNYKTETYCDNLQVKGDDGIIRKIHSVLTYKMESNRYGCINRDKNAVNNMKKLVDSYLKTKERPLNFRRGYELPDANLCKAKTLQTSIHPRPLV